MSLAEPLRTSYGATRVMNPAVKLMTYAFCCIYLVVAGSSTFMAYVYLLKLHRVGCCPSLYSFQWRVLSRREAIFATVCSIRPSRAPSIMADMMRSLAGHNMWSCSPEIACLPACLGIHPRRSEHVRIFSFSLYGQQDLLFPLLIPNQNPGLQMLDIFSTTSEGYLDIVVTQAR